MATTPEQFHNARVSAPEAAPRQETKEDSAKLFDEVLKDKFENVPSGTFKSDLLGVESITLKPLKPGKSEKKAFWATIAYRAKNGKEKSKTLVVEESGAFLGEMPEELRLRRPEVIIEILRLLKGIHISFWHKTSHDILPLSDEGTAPERMGGADTDAPAESLPVDKERLAFLVDQPRALFGFENENNGFDGYVGTFFLPRTKGRSLVVVLENERVGNAAFVYTLPEDASIEVNEGIFALSADERVSEKLRKEITDKLWQPVADRAKTRRGIKALGAARVVHMGDDWKKRLQEAIDEATQ